MPIFPSIFWSKVLFLAWIMVCTAAPAQAYLYHAASRAVARSIASKGIDPSKFNAKARFGEGFYLSKRASTALAEKRASHAVVRFEENLAIKKLKPLDLRKPTAGKLRKHLGEHYDLRGAYKGSTVGPKAGRELGLVSGKQARPLWYRSRISGGTNVFFPKKLFSRHSKILQPKRTTPSAD